MLHISIICIGKTNEAYVKDGIDKYNKLLSKYSKFEFIELPDVKNANKLPPEKLMEAEAQALQAYMHERIGIIFLDENGKQFTSEKFAWYLQKKTTEYSKLLFVIGGSYGLSDELLKKGESLSLSAMTFNHQMVRVILAEQLFRAFTIIQGTGYHH
jgi:23S rRNA (pseudouridine1915-N3)-methyltransferase